MKVDVKGFITPRHDPKTGIYLHIDLTFELPDGLDVFNKIIVSTKPFNTSDEV